MSGFSSPNRPKSFLLSDDLHRRASTPTLIIPDEEDGKEDQPFLKRDKTSFDQLEEAATPSKSTTTFNFRQVRRKVGNYVAITIIFVFLLAVLVWDLRRAQSISDVIHDDRQGLWERMNDSSVKRWFSAYDICLLTNSDKKISSPSNPEEILGYETEYKNCSKLLPTSPTMKNKALVNSRLFCNIGSSLGKACPAPLSSRKYFYYQLKNHEFQHYDDYNHKFIQSLKKLANNQIMIIFIGDGLSKQNFDALICEISYIEKNNVQIIIPNDYSNNHNDYFTNNINEFTIQWKETISAPSSNPKGGKSTGSTTKVLSLTIRYYKMPEIYSDTSNNNNNPAFMNELIDFDYLSRVTSEYLQFFRKRRLNRTQDLNNDTPHRHHNNREEKQKKRRRRKLVEKPQQQKIQNSNNNNVAAGSGRPVAKKNVTGSPQRPGGKANSTAPNNKPQPIMKPKVNLTSVAILTKPKPPSTMKPTPRPTSTPRPTQPPRVYFNHSLSFPEVKYMVEALLYPNQTIHESNSSHTGGGKSVTAASSAASFYKGVFIIANVGVHYNSREKFRIEMPFFLQWLEEIANDPHHKNFVYYRETAAQHWNHTNNGYYDREYSHDQFNNGTCVPLADATPILDWRNIDVYNLLEKNKLKKIHMIPFHELTMPLYNMHAGNSRFQDCTHYCYLPQMWQPIWHQIYSATKKMFGDVKR
eukprot:gene1486-1574_t